MKVAYTLTLALAINFLTAQNQKLDSLQKIIDNYGPPDTTYINLRMDFMKEKLFLTPTDTTWLNYALASLKISEELNYPKGQALSFEKIGVIYQYLLSDPYAAIDNYQKSLEIIENNDVDKTYAIGVYGNIGNIYYEQGELRKALGYYFNALGHNEHNITALTNIGNIYGDLHINDSSIYYYKKAIDIAKKTNNTLYEAHGLSNMALILHKEDKNIEALENMTVSLDLIDKHGLEFIKSNAYANAGMVYLGNNDIEKAEYYSKKALDLKSSLDNLFIQKAIWGTLSDVYEYKKDYENAFLAHKKYSSLNDSIKSEDRKLEVSRKEIQFEADKKQALAQAEIERQRTIKKASLMGGGGLLFATLFGAFLYKRRRDALEQKTVAEYNAKVADTELKALRAQMNPHFIFNSLNSINAYIAKNDKDAASDYLIKFAKLMRQTLENSEKREIPLSEDLELLETYLDIESRRLNHKFTYEIKVDETLDAENTLVPPLILQPFMENSIWHGIVPKDGTGHIAVDVQRRDAIIVYALDDDGVGIKKDRHLNGKDQRQSLGMKLTKNRIDIINQRKNSHGDVRVISKSQGVRVEVELPLELAF